MYNFGEVPLVELYVEVFFCTLTSRYSINFIHPEIARDRRNDFELNTEHIMCVCLEGGLVLSLIQLYLSVTYFSICVCIYATDTALTSPPYLTAP